MVTDTADDVEVSGTHFPRVVHRLDKNISSLSDGLIFLFRLSGIGVQYLYYIFHKFNRTLSSDRPRQMRN
jgi:hypothetical protein